MGHKARTILSLIGLAAFLTLITACSPPVGDIGSYSEHNPSSGKQNAAGSTPTNSREQQVVALLSKLQTSINQMDINAILECMDPSVTVIANLASSLMGDVIINETGISGDLLGQTVDALPDIMRVMVATGYADRSQMPNIIITPLEYQLMQRYVRVRVRYAGRVDGEYSEGEEWVEIDDSTNQPFLRVGLPNF